MYDKRKPLPLGHIKLIFTEIAHFHGKWLKWINMAKNKTLPTDTNTAPLPYDTFQVFFLILN